jgi:phosphatidate cytidylyltransferase
VLKLRVLSALVLVPMVAFFVWAGDWLFVGFIGALALVGACEFGNMQKQSGFSPNWIALLGLPLVPILDAYRTSWQLGRWVPAVVLIASLAWSALRSYDHRREVYGWGLSLAGAVYVGLPLSYFVLLRQLQTQNNWEGVQDGVLWLAVVFGATWAADTGAYFTGRLFGRTRMSPGLSPSKTWEGAFGGILFATIATMLLAPQVGIPTPAAFGFGLVLSIAAIVGDLAESWLKRGFGVKDTSKLIPGHGGVLDRLDSLLFVAVVVYCLGPLLVGAVLEL